MSMNPLRINLPQARQDQDVLGPHQLANSLSLEDMSQWWSQSQPPARIVGRICRFLLNWLQGQSGVLLSEVQLWKPMERKIRSRVIAFLGLETQYKDTSKHKTMHLTTPQTLHDGIHVLVKIVSRPCPIHLNKMGMNATCGQARCKSAGCLIPGEVEQWQLSAMRAILIVSNDEAS